MLHNAVKRIPDIIIVVSIIAGATAIATGYRWLGGIFLVVALLVGWKRNWCSRSFVELVGSSECSARAHGSSSVSEHSSDDLTGDSGGDADGGDGD